MLRLTATVLCAFFAAPPTAKGMDDRVIDSFVRNVWSHRMRCFPCHTPHEIDNENRYEKYHREFGDRMHLFQKTPEQTVQYLIEASRKTPKDRLPLINLEDPRRSLLLLKPSSKRPNKKGDKFDPPSSVEPVTHIGSLMIDVDDFRYKSFFAWIQDYARVAGGQNASAKDLSADYWYPSNYSVRIRRGPKDWPMDGRVQLFVYRWNDSAKAWEREPIAFTQGPLKTRRKSFTGTLIVLGPKNGIGAKPDREDATLPPGKYLIKAYLDSKRRLAADPAALLGEEDFYGQTEIKARWRKGFRDAELIRGEFVKP